MIQQLPRIAGIAQRDAVGYDEGGTIGIVVDGVGPSGIDGEGHAGRIGSSAIISFSSSSVISWLRFKPLCLTLSQAVLVPFCSQRLRPLFLPLKSLHSTCWD